MATGIDPAYAPPDRMRVSWFCIESRIRWAIHHVCGKYDLAPSEVVVLPVVIGSDDARKFRSGVWVRAGLTPAERIGPHRETRRYLEAFEDETDPEVGGAA